MLRPYKCILLFLRIGGFKTGLVLQLRWFFDVEGKGEASAEDNLDYKGYFADASPLQRTGNDIFNSQTHPAICRAANDAATRRDTTRPGASGQPPLPTGRSRCSARDLSGPSPLAAAAAAPASCRRRSCVLAPIREPHSRGHCRRAHGA